jgi:hypothetical protein
MSDKPKVISEVYWCTCVDDPALCLGCAVERLVKQVLGDQGSRFLDARVYKTVKKKERK